jgi:hypothetical protein
MGRYAGWSVAVPGSSSEGLARAVQTIAEANAASNTWARPAAGVMSPAMNRLAANKEKTNEFPFGIDENRSD